MAYDVSVEVTLEAPEVDVGALHELAERVMRGEGIAEGTQLAILITDDAELRDLNHRFLGIDEPTDVLSFPDEAEGFIQGVEVPPLLGDIAISLETAARQAHEVGHSLDAEIAHLLVHGILHLCGYDHVESPEQEAEMRAREEQYLGGPSSAHRH